MEREYTKLMRGDNGRGVLLIHGFAGTPKEMEGLANALNGAGYTVLSLCLSGHSTSVEDMRRYTAESWLSDAREGMEELLALCPRSGVCGLSMGGDLAMLLAAEYELAGAVFCSAPFWAKSLFAPLAPRLHMLCPYIGRSGRKPPRPEDRGDPYDGYDGFYTVTVGQLLRTMRMAKTAIEEVRCPALIVEAGRDRVIQKRSITYQKKHIGSMDARYLYLPKSGHCSPIGAQKELLFEAAVEFFDELG